MNTTVETTKFAGVPDGCDMQPDSRRDKRRRHRYCYYQVRSLHSADERDYGNDNCVSSPAEAAADRDERLAAGVPRVEVGRVLCETWWVPGHYSEDREWVPGAWECQDLDYETVAS